MTRHDQIELHFLRHAHAGDALAYDGPDDRRPLSTKGEKQATRLGRLLAATGFRPDAIVTSPKVRAARTAELVADHLDVAVSVDPRLGGGLDLATVEAILADLGGPARPVLVGHDPDFSELVASLVGAGRIPMRKGALARIDVSLPLVAGAGTLRWLLPPDLLEDR